MNYVLLGLSHKTAPIALREKLALNAGQSRDFLCSIRTAQEIGEAAVLSTCNRVEIYGVSPDPHRAGDFLRKRLSDFLRAEMPPEYFYEKTGGDAVGHLFRVAASLDSMVVGEAQITGQVKQAYQQACDCEAVGPHLHRLFHRAFSVAGRVKTETEIGRGQVSLGSVAVMLAKKIFGSAEAPTVVVFGAGKMGRAVLTTLQAAHPGAQVFLFNRTFANARHLAEQGLGQARPLEDLKTVLTEAQIFITSVTEHDQDFSKEAFATLMDDRRNSPLFLIDLAVPRNIPADVATLANVYLYNVDDLQSVAAQNQTARAEEARLAQGIVDDETRAFCDQWPERETASTIAELHKKMERTRIQEVQKTLSKLGHLSDADKRAIDQLTQSLVNKVLHEPILHLKYDDDIRQAPVLNLISRIFSLKDEDNA